METWLEGPSSMGRMTWPLSSQLSRLGFPAETGDPRCREIAERQEVTVLLLCGTLELFSCSRILPSNSVSTPGFMTPDHDAILTKFLYSIPAGVAGAFMTDLDGTAVHEFEGRLAIPDRLALAMRDLNGSGRQVIINSLRFPLSVIRTFGREWYSVSNAPLPIVSLNGSLTGYLMETDAKQIAFRELDAFCLSAREIEELVEHTAELLKAGHDEMVLFLYPRDWRKGELIWTPAPRSVERFRNKYTSASDVFATSLEDLKARLTSEPHCMVFLLVETTGDHLMAYQHVSQRRFVTRQGVDKRFGAHVLCERLGLAVEASVGAGDTLMDTFLSGIGLAITVGAGELGFEGIHGNLRVASSSELGELIFRLAELDRKM